MVIGLTGGIGSGKSMAAKIFEALGCLIFDSDHNAKHVYFEPGVRHRVIALLGEGSYVSSKEIDKRYIAEKIFADPALLTALNNIIHPAVTKMFESLVAANPGRIIVKESALLFEAGLSLQADKIVVVAADDETRVRRVMKRDGLGRDDVNKKMQSQMPQQEKIKRADFVVDNNGEQFLIPQIINILNSIKHA